MSLLSLFQWRRVTGIAVLFALGYFLLFGVLGNVDVSWLFPKDKPGTKLRAHWPSLPFFTMRQEPTPDGKGTIRYYTVPTRQLTAQEIAALEANGKPTSPPAHAPAAR